MRHDNPYLIQLRIMGAAGETDSLESVLGALSRAIRSSAKRADDCEALADDECALIEDLLGVAFVACQTCIVRFTTAAIDLLSYFEEQNNGAGLLDTRPSKFSLMEQDRSMIGEPSHTRIEVLWAFGNYYKHSDEWEGWDVGQAARTTSVLRAVGVTPGSTYVLRRAADVLGCGSFDHLEILVETIESWKHRVIDLLRARLARRGLLRE